MSNPNSFQDDSLSAVRRLEHHVHHTLARNRELNISTGAVTGKGGDVTVSGGGGPGASPSVHAHAHQHHHGQHSSAGGSERQHDSHERSHHAMASLRDVRVLALFVVVAIVLLQLMWSPSIGFGKRRVAVTVLFAAGNRADWGEALGPFVDGACVLRQSMLKYKPADIDLDFIALLKTDRDLPNDFRMAITKCGYRMHVALPKVELSSVPASRKQSILARAVGLVELLKLESLLLTEYEVVMCLDADIMFVGPYDDLVAPYTAAPYRMSFDFNGGMIVYYPHNDGAHHVAEILNTFLTARWNPSTGYGETGIGEGRPPLGFSGGPMNQGLLPYYLYAKLGVNPRAPQHVIAPCRHNNQNFDTVKIKGHFCSNFPSDMIRSVHFKGKAFPKPWDCHLLARNPKGCPLDNYTIEDVRGEVPSQMDSSRCCGFFHARFLDLQKELLDSFYGSDAVQRLGYGCVNGTFSGINRFDKATTRGTVGVVTSSAASSGPDRRRAVSAAETGGGLQPAVSPGDPRDDNEGFVEVADGEFDDEDTVNE